MGRAGRAVKRENLLPFPTQSEWTAHAQVQTPSPQGNSFHQVWWPKWLFLSVPWFKILQKHKKKTSQRIFFFIQFISSQKSSNLFLLTSSGKWVDFISEWTSIILSDCLPALGGKSPKWQKKKKNRVCGHAHVCCIHRSQSQTAGVQISPLLKMVLWP